MLRRLARAARHVVSGGSRRRDPRLAQLREALRLAEVARAAEYDSDRSRAVRALVDYLRGVVADDRER